MRIICIDMETYYAQDYTLSSLTTEAYVRDPRFETIGVGVIDDATDEKFWFNDADFREWAAKQDWKKAAILCHHAHFDGAILSWRYGINPGLWLDTLSMSRAVVGGFSVGGSLAKLATHFGIGQKGTEVIAAKDKRYADFTYEEWERYGEYCLNDCELTLGLFRLFMNGFCAPMERQITSFPKFELKLIDRTIRMFTEPTLQLDSIVLAAELAELTYKREQALELGGVPREELMSNPKFAEALRSLGVEPPMKTSPTTGKPTYAFAKTDKAMTELAEHEDERVQLLVAARLKNKSTIAETRVARLLGIAKRGTLPVYLNYCGADQSHRFSGGDKLNCLVGDTEITVLRAGEVLCIMLSALADTDLVWDGEAFVSHGGLVFQGIKEVITYDNITGTPDHKVFTTRGEEPVELGVAAREGLVLRTGRLPPRMGSPTQDVPSGERQMHPGNQLRV
jgi:DNA polymerase